MTGIRTISTMVICITPTTTMSMNIPFPSATQIPIAALLATTAKGTIANMFTAPIAAMNALPTATIMITWSVDTYTIRMAAIAMIMAH